jgi:hypothetical protein
VGSADSYLCPAISWIFPSQMSVEAERRIWPSISTGNETVSTPLSEHRQRKNN